MPSALDALEPWSVAAELSLAAPSVEPPEEHATRTKASEIGDKRIKSRRFSLFTMNSFQQNEPTYMGWMPESY
jgi:hypothetical protein